MIESDTNIPSPSFTNLFDEDPVARTLFAHWMGPSFAVLQPKLTTMGRNAAIATALSARADKHGPVLQTHSASGQRIDRVTYHPDYHQLEQLSYGEGIVAIKYDPAFLAQHKRVRHLAGFALGYVFGQTGPGLFCPICMAGGVGRVLERHVRSEVAHDTIRHLASTNRSELWQGAMFLTEKQGGSDVGANQVVAKQDGERWRLYGDKWFCSNVDAEAILALARMPGGPAGTKGLGLFLVLRHRPQNNGATIRIHRLKDKLGVRSMPTGEVTLEGTEAFLVGGMEQGFKQMAEMLNLSRLYNAVASVAGTRRAILEAIAYGSERRAFGQRLIDLPLWRSNMADLQAEFLGMFALVFETVRALDASDTGDALAKKRLRLLTPIAKALSGKYAMFAVSECMEAIGGNAYIEESILPRLLRDCQVLPIWEGTTNVLALDALRAIRKDGAHEALHSRLASALQAALRARLDSELIGHLEARMHQEQAALEQMASSDDGTQQRASRQWIESAGRTASMALLLETAALCDAMRDVCLAAVRRMQARPYSTTPAGAASASQMQSTEEVVLRSVWSR